MKLISWFSFMNSRGLLVDFRLYHSRSLLPEMIDFMCLNSYFFIEIECYPCSCLQCYSFQDRHTQTCSLQTRQSYGCFVAFFT